MNDPIGSRIPDKEKPPRECPGGETDANCRFSALERIAARSIFGPGGGDGQAHLLAEDAGNKTTDRMSLPAGGFHKIGPGGAARALQQAEELGGLAARAAGGGPLGRL